MWLGCGLSFGNIIGIVLVPELSEKSVIPMVSCKFDTVEMLVVSVVAAVGAHGSTLNGTDLMNSVIIS